MFKVQEMRELISLIDKSTISEFTYKNDDAKLTIKKELGNAQVIEGTSNESSSVATPKSAPATQQETAPKSESTAAKEEPSEATEENVGIEEVVSPMVGTFYQKPSPESDPYVAIGDKVEEESIVCIVEAMKLFNELEAELNGEIVEILVNDGDLVEYGQPLFKVKTKKGAIQLIKKILIANRGEIAVRIIRACKELDIQTVAVYSEVDKESLHVQLADEAYCIGPAAGTDSYLNMYNIISVASSTGTDEIHLGYGFLAENADFSELCEECNIKFIGPSAEAIRKMGVKDIARKTMDEAGVPIVPGSDGIVEDEAEAIKVAEEIGYPVIIK